MADHFAPLTWHRCVSDGCSERVDPWDHNTRCRAHRPADPATVDPAAVLAAAGITRRTCTRCGRRDYDTDTTDPLCRGCRVFTLIAAGQEQ